MVNFKLGTAGSLPRFDVPPDYTIDSYFEKVTRDGFEDRRKTIDPLVDAGRIALPDLHLPRAAREGDRGHSPGRLLGLLPHRLGLHPVCPRAGDSRRTRPRLGRG